MYRHRAPLWPCRSSRDRHLLCGRAFFDAARAAGDAGVIIDYLRVLPRGAARSSTYQHAISAARGLRDQRAAFAVLDVMEERGAAPDSHHWSNALAVCKATGDVDAAFQRFGQMTAGGVPVDTHVLTALVAACAAHIRKLRDERRRARADSLAGRLEVPSPLSSGMLACAGALQHCCVDSALQQSNTGLHELRRL